MYTCHIFFFLNNRQLICWQHDELGFGITHWYESLFTLHQMKCLLDRLTASETPFLMAQLGAGLCPTIFQKQTIRQLRPLFLWSDVRWCESRQANAHAIVLSLFTQLIHLLHVYNRLQNHECLWGETVRYKHLRGRRKTLTRRTV